MRTFFAWLFALAVSVVLAGPCAATGFEIVHDDNQAAFQAKWTVAYPADARSVPSNYNCVVQWPDGYPGNATGRSNLAYLGDNVQGTTPNYSGIFQLPEVARTFGAGGLVVIGSISLCNGCGYPAETSNLTALGGKAPYTSGQTLVQVAGYDSAASAAAGSAVFKAVPGAVVKLFERDNGENYPATVTVRTWQRNNKSVTGALFGVNPGGTPTDGAYPSGSANAVYRFTCSAPGYKPLLAVNSPYDVGSTMPGRAYIITMYPPDRAEASTVAGGTSTPDGITTANAPPPAGGGDTGGTTGGNTGSGGGGTAGGGWFDSFWENFKAKMQEVFVPSPAALTALKTKWLQLATWGPFGYPAQIAGLWDYAQTRVTNGNPTLATYWYFYLMPGDGMPVFPLTGPEIGRPKDYDPATAYRMAIPVSPVPIPDVFPRYLDLNPFVGPILYLRALLLIAVWFYFLMGLYKYFIPRLKV
jgi:hypothetical protein